MSLTRPVIQLRRYQSTKDIDNLYNDSSVSIYAPEWVSAELKKISDKIFEKQPQITFDVVDTQKNRSTYTIKKENGLTLNDLMIIARNECANTTGIIDFNLYQGLDIGPEVIFSIKDLVKHCVIVGKDNARAYGGFGHVYNHQKKEWERSPVSPFQQPVPVYVCDLSGFQFQQNYNNGRLVLISKEENAFPKGLLDQEIFKNTVGEPKRTYTECENDNTNRYAEVTCFGKKCFFDKVAFKKFVAQDVVLSGKALDEIASKDKAEINFKFLKYGAGYFSQSLDKNDKHVLLDALQEGVYEGLRELLEQGCHSIKQIELPYFNVKEEKKFIDLCAKYNITCVFSKEDALKQTHPKYSTAVTNCSDPHAAPGNEMHHASMDAAIAENLQRKANNFSPVLNTKITSKYINLKPSPKQEIKPQKVESTSELGLANFKLLEKDRYDYIYVDEKNQVHVFIPLSGGQEIGLDNTCQAARELQSFFGKGINYDPSKTAIQVIQKYIDHLTADLIMLDKVPNKNPSIYALISQKKERLVQLDKNLALIKSMSADVALTTNLNKSFPEYPEEINTALSDGNTNCVGITLSPAKEDNYTRIKNPLISFKRKADTMNPQDIQYRFAAQLQQVLQPHDLSKRKVKTLSNKIIDEACEKYRSKFKKSKVDDESDFENLKSCIKETTKFYLPDQEFDFTKVRDSKPKMNLDFGTVVNTLMVVDAGDPDINFAKEIFDSAIDKDIINSFNAGSPFDELVVNLQPYKERFSILCQFLIGVINTHCYETNLCKKVNFGTIIENNKNLTVQLLGLIDGAIKNNEDIENVILTFINKNRSAFSLQSELSINDVSVIKAKFKNLYTVIKDSPHFDEFLIFLPDKQGSFYNVQSRISIHMGEYCRRSANPTWKNTDLPQQVVLPRGQNGQFTRTLMSAPHLNTGLAVPMDIMTLSQLESKVIAQLIISASLPENWKEAIKTFPNWQKEIVPHVMQMLTSSELNAFVKAWNIPLTFYITPEVEQILTATYYSFPNTAKGLMGLDGKDKIQEILFKLQIPYHDVVRNENGGYIVSFDNSTQAGIKKLIDKSQATESKFYILPYMAAGLYQEACRISGNLFALDKYNNSTSPANQSKMFYALKILLENQPAGSIDGINLEYSDNGFIVKGDIKKINQIRAIYHATLPTYQLSIEQLNTIFKAAKMPVPHTFTREAIYKAFRALEIGAASVEAAGNGGWTIVSDTDSYQKVRNVTLSILLSQSDIRRMAMNAKIPFGKMASLEDILSHLNIDKKSVHNISPLENGYFEVIFKDDENFGKAKKSINAIKLNEKDIKMLFATVSKTDQPSIGSITDVCRLLGVAVTEVEKSTQVENSWIIHPKDQFAAYTISRLQSIVYGCSMKSDEIQKLLNMSGVECHDQQSIIKAIYNACVRQKIPCLDILYKPASTNPNDNQAEEWVIVCPPDFHQILKNPLDLVKKESKKEEKEFVIKKDKEETSSKVQEMELKSQEAKPYVRLYLAQDGSLAIKFNDTKSRDQFLEKVGQGQIPSAYRKGPQFQQNTLGMTPVKYVGQSTEADLCLYCPSYKTHGGEVAINLGSKIIRDHFLEQLGCKESESKNYSGQTQKIFQDSMFYVFDGINQTTHVLQDMTIYFSPNLFTTPGAYIDIDSKGNMTKGVQPLVPPVVPTSSPILSMPPVNNLQPHSVPQSQPLTPPPVMPPSQPIVAKAPPEIKPQPVFTPPPVVPTSQPNLSNPPEPKSQPKATDLQPVLTPPPVIVPNNKSKLEEEPVVKPSVPPIMTTTTKVDQKKVMPDNAQNNKKQQQEQKKSPDSQMTTSPPIVPTQTKPISKPQPNSSTLFQSVENSQKTQPKKQKITLKEDANRRNDLIEALNHHMERIESYKGNKKKNTRSEFWIFPTRRAANRQANYLLAKVLRDELKAGRSIDEVFSKINIENKRNPKGAVRSSDLKNIIEAGRDPKKEIKLKKYDKYQTELQQKSSKLKK